MIRTHLRCPECGGPVVIHQGLGDHEIFESRIVEYEKEIEDLHERLRGAERRIREILAHAS